MWQRGLQPSVKARAPRASRDTRQRGPAKEPRAPKDSGPVSRPIAPPAPRVIQTKPAPWATLATGSNSGGSRSGAGGVGRGNNAISISDQLESARARATVARNLQQTASRGSRGKGALGTKRQKAGGVRGRANARDGHDRDGGRRHQFTWASHVSGGSAGSVGGGLPGSASPISQMRGAANQVNRGPSNKAGNNSNDLTALVSQHRRKQNELRHKAFKERSAQNNKTAAKGAKKGQRGGGLSSSGAQEQSSLFDWVKPMPKKKSKKDKAKARQKVSEATAIRGMGGNGMGPRKTKKVVVITPAQLEIAQKVARGEELTEEENEVRKLVQNKARKKRKKRPTRLKRILMNERKEHWVATRGSPEAVDETKDDAGLKVEGTSTATESDGAKGTPVVLGTEGEATKEPPCEPGGGVIEATSRPDDAIKENTFEKDTVHNLKEDAHGDREPESTNASPDTKVEAEKQAAPEPVSAADKSLEPAKPAKPAKPFKYPRVPNKQRVREYVVQNLDLSLDQTVSSMLRTLFKFQEKARLSDPLKAKQSRRIVLGLREVFRGVRTKRARAVIVATDIEESPTEGGLDSRVRGIISMAEEHSIPVIYSLSRRKLGKSLKKVKTSCIAIQSGDGAWEELKRAIKMAASLQAEWQAGIRRPNPYDPAVNVTKQTAAASVAQTAGRLDNAANVGGPALDSAGLYAGPSVTGANGGAVAPEADNSSGGGSKRKKKRQKKKKRRKAEGASDDMEAPRPGHHTPVSSSAPSGIDNPSALKYFKLNAAAGEWKPGQ